ncbi:MAG: ABC transporter substrate-binding protein [Ectothiorhodospiraceae bacterium]|nr:ABC transporter substrate-binding protein [Ectothiorhodospiraceae bacterium]
MRESCRRWASRGLLLGAVLVLLAGCADEPPIRLGTNVFPGYEPLYLAREIGLLDADCVRLVEYVSATQVSTALANGAVDAVTVTLDEALLLASRGIDLRVVAVTDYSNGTDAVLGRGEVRTLADIAGRRVGVETTALGSYMLARTLAHAGLEESDVEIVGLELHEQEPAFAAGRIDAVVTFDPVRQRLVEAGASVLFDSRSIPGEIVDLIAVAADVATERTECLRGLVTAWHGALKHLRDAPEAARAAMQPRLGLEPEQIRVALDGLHFPSRAETARMLGGATPALAAVSRQVRDVMERSGILEDGHPESRLIDTALTDRLYQ